LRPAGAPIELTRAGAELPSRVADNLFWLGRYLERAEGTARIARAILARSTIDSADTNAAIPPLLAAMSRHAGLAEEVSGEEEALLDLLFVQDSPRTLRATLAAVHQLAFSLRDQISLDTWRVLSELHQDFPDDETPVRSAPIAQRILNRMIVWISAWNGLAMENMTRTLGWRFADMGRRIERGAWTATLVSACLGRDDDDEGPRIEALLEVAESAITYRRRYRGELQAVPALDLLLTDETNPRSLAFQLVALEEHVGKLPGAAARSERLGEARIALAAQARVRLADVADLGRSEAGKRLRLEELLARTLEDLRTFSDALTRSYLSHAGEARRIEHF
jgi:uncharacterized alpha-E superfamily protein